MSKNPQHSRKDAENAKHPINNGPDSYIARYFTRLDNKSMRDEVERISSDFLTSEKICDELAKEKIEDAFKCIEIPDAGMPVNDFLVECEKFLLPNSVNTGVPRFIGHMTGLLPNFIREIAKLKSSLNQNMVKLETAKSATYWENQALCMTHKLVYGFSKQHYEMWIHNPDYILGNITSGGTVANITALQCARARSLACCGDVEREGLHTVLQRAGVKRTVILVSELGHYSIKKSLALLGLGKDNVVKIKANAQRRMDISHLRRQLQQCKKENVHVCAVVGVAGTTECGSFDPLHDIADLTDEFDCYFHVDAAWGGPFMMVEQSKALLAGIERADSVTIDGHKQLYLPVGTGMVLFKDPQLPKVISNEADYIIRQGSPDLGRVSLDGSRSANVFYLQASYKLLGKSGFNEILGKNVHVARAIATIIDESDDFQLLTYPQSNIFLYRFVPPNLRKKRQWSKCENKEIDRINIKIQETQCLRGNGFVSRTRFAFYVPEDLSLVKDEDKVVALRVVIANPLTTIEDGHCVLEEQRDIVNELQDP